MPGQFTIPQIESFVSISQYLAANDKASITQLQSGSFVGILPQLLYMEGTLLQNLNTLNPGSPTLRGTAEYVLSLCGKYLSQAIQIVNNLAGSRPIITGPANESTTVGGSVTFSVSVTGSAPFTYQWLLNGVVIPGATSSAYVVANAQLSQNGGLYSVAVTNSVTTTTSNQATLTVTANLVGYYYQGATDYSTLLEADSDTVAYLGTFPITTGQPFTVTFPDLVSTEYIVVKYPSTEPTKTSYLNPPPSGPDTGPIPNIALNNAAFGSWKYVFSRTGNTFALNSINGEVKFS
jgi:hypothetical protein